jgi:hypothetical protein
MWKRINFFGEIDYDGRSEKELPGREARLQR